ncbi:MAG: hypothetical protein Q9188_005415 [Gyalolechia gomerana]
MHRLTQHRWLAVALLISILTILTDAYPSPLGVSKRRSPQENIERHLLVPRTDDPFLGEEWDIITMDNHAAYLPPSSAARDLEAFYTSLQTVALQPINFSPEHYFAHRINRVLITFHSRGTTMPWSLILRFANGMLEFTRRGYTSAYRMRFRHSVYGFVLEVTLTVDDPPPAEPECAVAEEHGEVNQSGIRQTCILRPPSFPH